MRLGLEQQKLAVDPQKTKEATVGEQAEQQAAGGLTFFRDGAVTVGVLLLAFAAVDDITTDDATAFPLEYSILVVCVVWLLFLGWNLLRSRHRFLGGMSVLAAGGSVWAQRAIGRGIVPDLWPVVVITGAYLWFWTLSLTLLWWGWRSHQRGA